MKFTYLLVDFFTVIVPFVFSFHPKLNFHKNFKAFFLSNSLVAIVFVIWDLFFTKMGVWGFNSEYVMGIYFFNLPIEELLFFICIPFACVFTYHCLNLFIDFQWERRTEIAFVISLVLILTVIGIYFSSKWYTCSTFLSLSILLLIVTFLTKVTWLPKLVKIYPVLLVPFAIVNGVLTGSGIQEPVVWYNDNENLGIRLLTIPIEDVFYGFELIFLNVFFYEYFKMRFSKDRANVK